MTEVRLRETTAEDLEHLFALEDDAEAAWQMNFPHRSRERFMAHWTDRILADPAVVKRTIEVDGEIAGSALCWDESGDHMIGYWFGRRFWGRGIGTTAIRAFVDGIAHRPLYADPAVRNTASVRLLEKLGFTPVRAVMAPNHYGEGEVEHVMLKLD